MEMATVAIPPGCPSVNGKEIKTTHTVLPQSHRRPMCSPFASDIRSPQGLSKKSMERVKSKESEKDEHFNI
jgi:hypothetical protein